MNLSKKLSLVGPSTQKEADTSDDEEGTNKDSGVELHLLLVLVHGVGTESSRGDEDCNKDLSACGDEGSNHKSVEEEASEETSDTTNTQDYSCLQLETNIASTGCSYSGQYESEEAHTGGNGEYHNEDKEGGNSCVEIVKQKTTEEAGSNTESNVGEGDNPGISIGNDGGTINSGATSGVAGLNVNCAISGVGIDGE